MMHGRTGRTLAILALITAGEAAFLLPFVLPRVLRPTLLEVFDLTNLELGTAFSVYGIVAMLAYFLGGPLADRFSPRGMLALALTTTAAGGLLLVTVPSLQVLLWLYAWWGITTIALFWAPLIRATREWGRHDAQGAAFGLLDGGRGLVAAVTGTVMVTIFAAMLPEDPDTATAAERAHALRQVILFLSAVTCIAAICIYALLASQQRSGRQGRPGLAMHSIVRVLAMPTVWLQALIILCAYAGYKSIDDFSLYAREVLGFNEVDAARAGTVSLWVRPFAAVAAGYLADRLGSGHLTTASFLLLAAGSSGLASGLIQSGMAAVFLIIIVGASLGVFALRGLYFAIMREGRVPLAVTGTAVGFVSVIGFTPDVFMGPLMGYLIDRSPGPPGHQHLFWVIVGFALVGCAASLLFSRIARRAETGPPDRDF